MDKALEHIEKTLPLMTPEWSAWAAAMQPPKLAGRWAISGSQVGRGPIYGLVTIASDPGAPDSFTTTTRYIVARTGETVTRTGKGLVYTGYQWRGRGSVGSGASTGSDSSRGQSGDTWREVMSVERDWSEMSGRWFTGAYDETGIDVKLTRLSNDPVVLGASVTALKTGASGQVVRIFGANLPTGVRPEDVGLGPGVTIGRVVTAQPDETTVEVNVAATAPIGARDLSVGGTRKAAALVVYDKIDGIRVLPQAGMARVGGNVFPKQLQQFEAVGINNGPDGKPNTADDLNLGLVTVKWSVEEYTATFGDDDAHFVGTVDADGLFTPNVDGPNPKRSGNRNNIGDVWVVAELSSPDARQTSRSLRARAQLLVTVPIYMSWFESESGK